MTDSDDYFVVECQPRSSHFPTPSTGPFDPRSVAKGLASWATALHRENARHALVFHCGRHSPRLGQTIAVSGSFVTRIDGLSTTAPMPFRHHPLWPRALEHHTATASVEQDPARLAAISADPATAAAIGSSGISRLRGMLLGRAPYFRPWHPRWLDARALKQRLAVVAPNKQLAVVADVPARVRPWLEQEALAAGAISVSLIPTADLRSGPEAGSGEAAFGCCIFLSPDLASGELPEILSCLARLVRPGGAIVLGIGRIFSDAVGALPSIVPPPDLALADGPLVIENTDGVSGEPRRIAVQRAMMRFARNFSRPTSVGSVFSLAAAAGLAAISLCLNRTRFARAPTAGTPQFTSVFFTFRRSATEAIDGARSGPGGEPGDALRPATAEALPTSSQSLSCIAKDRRQPIRILQAAASQGAAGLTMQGR
jgi:hypothetical protein